MKVQMKKVVATVALAGAMTAGTAGIAYAQDSSSTTTPAPAAAAAKAHPKFRMAVRRHAGKIVADTLGVSRQDLRTALKGGQTISQYATSLNKDPATVSAALVTAANTAIDKAVTNGKLDAAKATELEGKVAARVAKVMDHQFGQGGA